MKLEKVIAVRTDKTVYRDGQVAIKVFNEDYSTANVLNEALNQARVEETGLAIPKLLEVSKIDGKWAIMTDFIEGKTLEQLMKENPEKNDEYMELFVDIQMDILSRQAPLLLSLIHIQHWIKDVDNKYIPTVLTVLGAVAACVAAMDFNIELVVAGAVSGLASTGLHQAFKQLIGDKEEKG